MDVGGWLRSLGLGQYEASFRDNKIDAGCVARTLDDDAKSEIRADPASRYAAISKRLATKAA
jgi:hypothetical protein